MNKKKVFQLVISTLIIIVGCKNISRQEISKEENSKPLDLKPCFNKNEKEKALESILNTQEFQDFLHPELNERLPLKLMKTSFITSDLNIKTNGLNVVYYDSLISGGNVVRIQFLDSICEQKKLNFSLYYPIESAIIQGTVSKKDSTWTTTVTSFGEID